MKRTGPPYQIDGQPALSQAGYQKAIQDRLQEITDAEAAVKQLVEETKALTLQIDGTNGSAIAGLHRCYMQSLADTPRVAAFNPTVDLAVGLGEPASIHGGITKGET